MTQIAIEKPKSAAPPLETRAPSPPRRRYGWLVSREVTLILGGLVIYRLVRLVVKDEIDQAFANSQTIVDWERAIGIFNEVGFQSTVLGSEAVVWILNRYYFFGHFGGMAMLLVWLFARHYTCYGRTRRVLFGTTFAALAIHLVFPLAPPRWFPDMGFVDTLQTYGPRIYDSETISSTANQIAAMPSLHVAWALIGAWAIVISSSSRWRWIAVAHPLMMTAAVVLTANHWWLDAIGAAVLVVIVAAVDTPIQRRLERRQAQRDMAPLASASA